MEELVHISTIRETQTVTSKNFRLDIIKQEFD